jgi:hypothetical protein
MVNNKSNILSALQKGKQRPQKFSNNNLKLIGLLVVRQSKRGKIVSSCELKKVILKRFQDVLESKKLVEFRKKFSNSQGRTSPNC